ncbi:MAG: excisionase [Clostridiales Family XIII bacterium]|jgi:hypothetical protein|nr:excisionase [Clostridiales Family XIII bacterium]
MDYFLMHKNIAVCDLTIDSATNAISRIAEIFAPEHLPVGTPFKDGRADRKFLNDWWTSRAIPASRSGLREALEAMRISSPGLLLTKCFGLSLSDQYWVRPKAKDLAWSDVNFFENKFSEDVGNALFGKAAGDDLDLMSPDNTSDGWLKKKWIIADGRRMLVKGGSGPAYQEPLNEVIAGILMDRLQIPHTAYTLQWDADQPLSVCEDFIGADTELISAWYIRETGKRPGHLSEYQHYMERCKALGIPGIREQLDRMIAIDFLMANTDRHFNNFGVVRHAETLEWIGAAPIYDTGTSLWHDVATHMILARAEANSKPFRSKHGEQIKLVTDFSWLDLSALQDADEEVSEILKQSAYIDEQRRDALCRALNIRIKMLAEAAAI